ncbi:MAG: hypothetical protein OXC26_18765 [Albidovulum sp.]|nr:hypothetical protein [Albidovulum sp.]
MSSKRKNFWDIRSPVLRPLWLRISIVAVCAVWTIVELLSGSLFWTIIFGAAAVFLFVQLLVKFELESDP